MLVVRSNFLNSHCILDDCMNVNKDILALIPSGEFVILPFITIGVVVNDSMPI